jgi:hypothetical protein
MDTEASDPSVQVLGDMAVPMTAGSHRVTLASHLLHAVRRVRLLV